MVRIDRRSARTRRLIDVAAVVALAGVAACSTSSERPAAPPPTTNGAPILPAEPTSTSSAPLTLPAATTVPVTVAPTVPETTTPPTVDPVTSVAQCLATWSLDDRIALLTWPSVYSDQWGTAEQVVRDNNVGGVILMKPSDSFAAELTSRLAALDSLSHAGLLVATDEEGGAVQRLRALQVLESQEVLSQQEAAVIDARLRNHAEVIAAAGIDVVLGPVVDVRPDNGDDPLGQGRLFRGDANRVADLGSIYVSAWQSAGMLPVLKHFPGHGAASADTHQSLATTPSLDKLIQRDLVPYARLAGSGAAVMVGHLDVPGLTDGEPASLNAAAIRLLRDELGYADALVLSDALGMGAVGVPVPEAAVRSIAAGVDVVLFTGTADTPAVIAAIRNAVDNGRLSVSEIDDSAARVARELIARGRPCVPVTG
jgi:beta-N-acetylhexosaminidase